MTRTRVWLLLMLLGGGAVASAQTSTGQTESERTYPFIILDSPPHLFTMRQVDASYVSGFRLFARSSNAHLKPALSVLVQGAASLLLLKTMTHEEGHRAILTGEGIDSGDR